MTLLTAVLLMAGCSEEQQTTDSPATGSQLVELALAVGTSTGDGGTTTRMTEAIVQGQTSPVFRGIQDIVMIPFNISDADAVGSSHSPLAAKVELPAMGIPTVTTANTISTLNSASNSQLYQGLTVPNTTNAFLFYGKATDATPTGIESLSDDEKAMKKKQLNGSFTITGLDAGAPSGIGFSPETFYGSDAVAPAAATAMADYVTGICNTENWSAQGENTTLGILYAKMTSLTVGSSPNVLAVLQNLYSKLLTLTELTGDLVTIKEKIIANMKIGSAATDVLTEGTNHALSWNPDYSSTKFIDYPASLGLPDGAATLKWDGTNKKYNPVLDGSIDNIGIVGNKDNLTQVPLNRYAYPVPLYYYVNSKVMVSESTQSEYYNDNTSDWSAVLAQYTTNPVSENVHSIALIKPVQYAVSRLDVILWGVNALDADAETLTDDVGETVQMSDLQLTGILVSGQKAVDFSFSPAGTDTYTLYDNTMNATINLTTNRGKDGSSEKPYSINHTLVLPTAEGEDVYLFFEFQNNSTKDISVKGGLVPPGCKLYLCGKIEGAETINNPKQVFASDAATVIKGTVSTLENAYNVVPPRETGISIKLQVGVKDWVSKGTTDHPVYNW